MEIKRFIEEKKLLDKMYKENNVFELLDNPYLIYKNNDFLKIRCNSFDWALNLLKQKVDQRRIDFFNIINCYREFGYLFDYFEIINKSVEFIKNNIEDDNIHRYAFIQSLFRNNGFSGGERNNISYKDFFYATGVDVILGHSCCRHKASLLKDILNSFESTLEIDVGNNENEIANHAIISFIYNNKRLFLDSVDAHMYIPTGNLEILDISGIHHVKTVPTYVMNKQFNNVDEYYSFFKHLYKKSKLSNDEFSDIFKKIYTSYYHYLEDNKLLKEFMNTIEKEQKELKLACGRK